MMKWGWRLYKQIKFSWDLKKKKKERYRLSNRYRRKLNLIQLVDMTDITPSQKACQ